VTAVDSLDIWAVLPVHVTAVDSLDVWAVLHVHVTAVDSLDVWAVLQFILRDAPNTFSAVDIAEWLADKSNG